MTAIINEHENTIYLGEFSTLIALDHVGKCLTRSLKSRSVRHHKSYVRQTDTWDRHRLFRVDPDQIDRLLANAFVHIDHVVPPGHCIRQAVEEHVRNLVRDGKPHDRADLIDVITRSGCLD